MNRPISVTGLWTSNEEPPEPPVVTTVRYRQIHHRAGFKFSTVVTTVKWIEIGILFLALMLWPTRIEADLTPGAGAPVVDVTGEAVTLDSDEETASVALQGQQGASVFIDGGTCSLTLVPEISVNNGSNWVAAVFLNAATGTVSSTVTMTNPNSTASYVIGYIGPATHARVRVSDYTSGSCVATLRAMQNRPYVVSYAASGTTLVPGTIGSSVSEDYDTGAGSELVPLYGIALPADGGAVAGGTITDPIQVAVPQSGNNLCSGRTVLTTSGTNAILCNNSSAVLYQVRAMNPLTTAYCLQVYNLTTTPTVGTSTPKQTFMISAAETTGRAAGFINTMTADGVAYDTGISMAVVATVTNACIDASTTAAGAGIQIDLIYRDKP